MIVLVWYCCEASQQEVALAVRTLLEYKTQPDVGTSADRKDYYT
jgi:hypothetical protein